MKHAIDVIPGWAIHPISFRPFDGFWSMNPSIHYDGERWRCAMRNVDYHAPHGVVLANMKRGGKVTTRNVMATLDPRTWQPIELAEMLEEDGNLKNLSVSSLGYEDLRLFRTEREGLLAICTTMQLRGDPKQEMAILRFEDAAAGRYNIVSATPIRGAWGEVPQKNWSPFDGALDVRLLYSIEGGILFDEKGPLDPARPLTLGGASRDAARTTEAPAPPSEPRTPAQALPGRGGDPHRAYNGGIETRHTPRVQPIARAGETGTPITRARGPSWTQTGLRGGSQLIALQPDVWLGIGHEMQWRHNRKNYWHVWFTCDNRGQLLERSEPMKLSTCGIEFAAGLALDDERTELVLSFGTEDQDSWIATMPLEAVLATLRPVAHTGAA